CRGEQRWCQRDGPGSRRRIVQPPAWPGGMACMSLHCRRAAYAGDSPNALRSAAYRPHMATDTQGDIERLLAHADWLRALATYLVRSPAEADDLVQETFVAALRSPPDPAR